MKKPLKYEFRRVFIIMIAFITGSCRQTIFKLNAPTSSKPDIAIQFSNKKLLVSSADLIKRMPPGDGVMDLYIQGKLHKLLTMKRNPADTVTVNILNGHYLFNDGLDTLDKWYYAPKIYSALLRDGCLMMTSGRVIANYQLRKKTIYGHCPGNRIRRTSKVVNIYDPETNTLIADSVLCMKQLSCF